MIAAYKFTMTDGEIYVEENGGIYGGVERCGVNGGQIAISGGKITVKVTAPSSSEVKDTYGIRATYSQWNPNKPNYSNSIRNCKIEVSSNIGEAYALYIKFDKKTITLFSEEMLNIESVDANVIANEGYKSAIIYSNYIDELEIIDNGNGTWIVKKAN